MSTAVELFRSFTDLGTSSVDFVSNFKNGDPTITGDTFTK
jgi:hypothetical protein